MWKKRFVIIDLDTKKYLGFYRIDEVKSSNIEDANEFDSELLAISWFKDRQDDGYFSEITAFKVRDYYKQIK